MSPEDDTDEPNRRSVLKQMGLAAMVGVPLAVENAVANVESADCETTVQYVCDVAPCPHRPDMYKEFEVEITTCDGETTCTWSPVGCCYDPSGYPEECQ